MGRGEAFVAAYAASRSRPRPCPASHHAANTLPIIAAIRAAGIIKLTDIANALNAHGIRTARDGRWYPTTVRNLPRRDLPSVQHIAA